MLLTTATRVRPWGLAVVNDSRTGRWWSLKGYQRGGPRAEQHFSRWIIAAVADVVPRTAVVVVVCSSAVIA